MALQARNMVKCGIFAALLCLCAWISIPFGSTVFTLQSLGVFLTLGLLGGKWGSMAILVYLFCGAAGLPVFSGFRGGFGMLLGATGGYLWGFLAAGLIYWLTFSFWKKPLPCLILSQFVCYLCGTVWYALAYGSGQLWQVIGLCVVPYLLPDGIKLWLALLLIRRLNRK